MASPVGTNKRYPYLAAQRAEENELCKARKAAPLQSLSDVQIRSHAVPISPNARRYTWRAARRGEVSFRRLARDLRDLDRIVVAT
ncbi:hypothetical protein GCM10023171_00040 [Microbacterium panaciterrae]|uniref:Transposase n=1 Tax=Microbacterium panaciterrae TaxID=985759 RepID=A0ABP8NYX4_9MICO